jgi:hypothetical protein
MTLACSGVSVPGFVYLLPCQQFLLCIANIWQVCSLYISYCHIIKSWSWNNMTQFHELFNSPLINHYSSSYGPDKENAMDRWTDRPANRPTTGWLLYFASGGIFIIIITKGPWWPWNRLPVYGPLGRANFNTGAFIWTDLVDTH